MAISRDARGVAQTGGRCAGRADRDPHDPRPSPWAAATPSGATCSCRTRAMAQAPPRHRWPATGRSRSHRLPTAEWTSMHSRAALGPTDGRGDPRTPRRSACSRKRIGELLEAVHEVGALAYMDGANLNAILGRFKPRGGRLRRDALRALHKTFSTPHGEGGPGAGPVGVGETRSFVPPTPRVPGPRANDGSFRLERPGERPTSIGRLRSYVGNTGVLVRACTPISAPTVARGYAGSATMRSWPPNYLMDRLSQQARTTCPMAGARASTSSSPRRPR